MEGIYKTGVLGAEAKPNLWPRVTRACREMPCSSGRLASTTR